MRAKLGYYFGGCEGRCACVRVKWLKLRLHLEARWGPCAGILEARWGIWPLADIWDNSQFS